MCIMVYMAADTELPLVPLNEESFICVVQPCESPVARQFSKNHIYYVGSYQGCGCGFTYDRNRDCSLLPPEVREFALHDDENRRRSVDGLIGYLRDNLPLAGEIELYSCWDGNEAGTAAQVSELTIDEFAARDEFGFEEDCKLVVRGGDGLDRLSRIV